MPERFPVTIVRMGDRPARSEIYFGQVVVLETSRHTGRILFTDGTIARFAQAAMCSAIDKGLPYPFLKGSCPELFEELKVGSFVACLLSVSSDQTLVVYKMTPKTVWTQVERSIAERKTFRREVTRLQPYTISLEDVVKDARFALGDHSEQK